jgi:hypothetical protein
LLVLLLFAISRLSAQIRYQQFTVGAGAGAATAYAGAAQNKTNAAFYGGMCYYPTPAFNVGLEVQGGTLSGAAPPNNIDLKSFTNSYKAFVLDANLYLGAFVDGDKNGFSNIIKNFYGGVGYGVLMGSINNFDLGNRISTDHINNTINIIPFNAGYEFSIVKNIYHEPVLKADISARLYYVDGRGLDGYYDIYAKSSSYYTFYSIGLKYTFIIHPSYGKGYKKYD